VQALRSVDSESRKVIDAVRQITEARKAEADATKNAADEARRAAEDSSRDARRRVEGLVESGLPEAQRSQLTLSQDLLAINRTIADAEAALQQAKQAGDLRAIAQAEERLRLTRETGAVAEQTAREQDRQRRLAARGIDAAILNPTQTLKQQIDNLRAAFKAGEITPEQARTGFLNLIREGIDIRNEIARELSRPAQQALQVSDIRTQEGASQLLALVTGRQDPAIEQRRQQLSKLEEIKQAIGRNEVIEIPG
jgi:hypothetical protein